MGDSISKGNKKHLLNPCCRLRNMPNTKCKTIFCDTRSSYSEIYLDTVHRKLNLIPSQVPHIRRNFLKRLVLVVLTTLVTTSFSQLAPSRMPAAFMTMSMPFRYSWAFLKASVIKSKIKFEEENQGNLPDTARQTLKRLQRNLPLF